MSKAKQSEDRINITSEDQKMISEFSKRHNRLREVQSELKAYADLGEKIKDCVTELDFNMPDDVETVDIKFGDSFLVATVDEAKEMCEAKQKELDEEVAKLTVQKTQLSGESDALKKKLYNKFGNAIQLEDN